ncbi:hypothetical protein KC725_04300 [Candidatus Peregrinibacteria bacterium]|nr:hypothetical protein [Candidatus Peregrinibacteria bacterium]
MERLKVIYEDQCPGYIIDGKNVEKDPFPTPYPVLTEDQRPNVKVVEVQEETGAKVLKCICPYLDSTAHSSIGKKHSILPGQCQVAGKTDQEVQKDVRVKSLITEGKIPNSKELTSSSCVFLDALDRTLNSEE